MGLTLDQLYTDLDNIRAKIREVIGTGAQYTLSGSHSVTQPGLSELRKEEKRILKRIRVYKGEKVRSTPDFGGGADSLSDYREGDYV